MIEFVTLLLGLVTGPHPVRVMVDESAVVEVVVNLDGREVARLHEPPWELLCDFSGELHPHVLTAVALGRDGVEVGRAEQWVNLPRRKSEVALQVSRSDGGGAVAHISWGNIGLRRPREIRLLLDGQAVEVNDPRRVELPVAAAGAPHILTAEVTFTDDRVARTDLAFGSGYFDAVGGELTALPLVVADHRSALSPATLSGRFALAGGPTIPVTSVEKGAAEVFIVVASGALVGMRSEALLVERVSRRRQLLDRMGVGNSAWIIVPLPRPVEDGESVHRLFSRSSRLQPWEVTAKVLQRAAEQAYRGREDEDVAAAVALAGVEACASGARRAVVLAIGKGESGRAAEVRRFLAELHVPLVVWTLAGRKAVTPWSDKPARSIDGASQELAEVLASQRIAWLSGRYPPHLVRLSGGATGGFKIAP